MSSSEDLDALELRVAEKWAAAAAARFPADAFDSSRWWNDIDISDWMGPLPPGTPQFPREQWARYPAKRTVCLLIADRLLDFDELTDEQWMQLSFLMQYGGKTRIS